MRNDHEGFVLEDLPYMKRILGKYESGKNVYVDRFGYPETFGEFIDMICSIFKISIVLMAPAGWDNRNNPACTVTPGTASVRINEWITKMHDKRFCEVA